ncbi:LLM class flavin-dependent oxidoreductase [Natrinema halophilum]|uniref:LLM class flavin-dependent oxidoreductase n=1 Tax=Natrinema halophilum TaxID=1699371 RepID=UPI001F38981C|nr:LLM class flavin-dependent oxidoreductase [Natrinema halophilum]UHQ96217.1 LLM class flavin-dependent oxidoreductase [Natrinema halophilum]
MAEEMHLNGFTLNCPSPHVSGIWTHPRDKVGYDYTDTEYWKDLATTLERGKFDALFIADQFGAYSTFKDDHGPAVRNAVQFPINDPLSIIPTMAEVTDHLGFAATLSTSFYPPYMLSRKLSSLDHLTNGRIAWNIVTSGHKNEFQNFGHDNVLPHDKRYERAEEFMEVCYKLWGSWEENAVEKDRNASIYANAEKVHQINHDGDNFSVSGPFLCEPSPQRMPVLYQAGQSDRGREFAAKHAEAVFTGQHSIESLQSYSTDIKSRAAEYGRNPDNIKIIPGILPIVGITEEDANEKHNLIKEKVSIEGSLVHLSGNIGVDFSEYDSDEYLEEMEVPGIQGMIDMFTKINPDKQWTVREAAERLSILSPTVVGTGEQVADKLIYWYEESDIDGFNIIQADSPGTLRDFVELVVPILQKRGYHRDEYSHQTMRDTLFETANSELPSSASTYLQ